MLDIPWDYMPLLLTIIMRRPTAPGMTLLNNVVTMLIVSKPRIYNIHSIWNEYFSI